MWRAKAIELEGNRKISATINPLTTVKGVPREQTIHCTCSHFSTALESGWWGERHGEALEKDTVQNNAAVRYRCSIATW